MKRWDKSAAGVCAMKECFTGFTPTNYR